MAGYALHCFARSGNAHKPALALQLAGADWAHPYTLMPGHPRPAQP
jgi:hypothetical protein